MTTLDPMPKIPQVSLDAELTAMRRMAKVLSPLTPVQRQRVLTHLYAIAEDRELELGQRVKADSP